MDRNTNAVGVVHNGTAVSVTESLTQIEIEIYGAQNEAYMSRSAEKWVRGLCFNELGVGG